MAFTLRIEDPNDIRSGVQQRKELAELAAFVRILYDQPIILDDKHRSGKRKIKIPLPKDTSLTKVKSELKKQGAKPDLFTIDFGVGSSPKSGGTSAVETAKQEKATMYYIEKYMKNQKATIQDLEKIYPNLDDDWMESFEVVAKKLKEWISPKQTTGYEYSREESGGMMNYLETLAKKYGGIRTKDSWNPMDIVMTKKSAKAKIMADLKKVENIPEKGPALDMLNDIMKQYFATRDLIGISLKKIAKLQNVKVEESNIEAVPKCIGCTIKPNSLNFSWFFTNYGQFETGEFSWKIVVDGRDVAVQSRAFSGNERESNQIDMTASGAGAKLGKVSSEMAIDPFLSKFGLSRYMGGKLPKVGKWTAADRKFWVDKFKSLKNVTLNGNSIDWGDSFTGTNDWALMLERAIQKETENKKVASNLSSKLQSLILVENMKVLDNQGMLDEFMEVMYYGAKKLYQTAGPFLKISD